MYTTRRPPSVFLAVQALTNRVSDVRLCPTLTSGRPVAARMNCPHDQKSNEGVRGNQINLLTELLPALVGPMILHIWIRQTPQKEKNAQNDNVAALEVSPQRVENNPPCIKNGRLLSVVLSDAGVRECNQVFPWALHHSCVIGALVPASPQRNAVPVGFDQRQILKVRAVTQSVDELLGRGR